MKPFVPLFLLFSAPIFGQDLPPLSPVPAAPLAPAQTVAPSQPAPAETVQPEKAAVLPPIPNKELETAAVLPPIPNKELETAAQAARPPAALQKPPAQKAAPKKEITYSEYKAARRLLYQQMRASESVFRRSGAWFDFSAISFNFNISRNYYLYDNRRYRFFSHTGLSLSFGRISKGFMSGISFQYTFKEQHDVASFTYSMPSVYDIAGVLGYRIAPDNFVGMRFMMHIGYGSAIHGRTAGSPSGLSPIRYVLLMPELKLDLKVYKHLVLTLGVAYKGTIFVGKSRSYASVLQSELGFNGVRALRASIGLAISY